MKVKQNKYMLAIFILLMISVIIILEVSWLANKDEANTASTLVTSSIPSEEATFSRSTKAMDYKFMEDIKGDRTLNEYYENRAYDGAPPVIPHPLLAGDAGMGGQSCLQCHANGGYVEQFKAFAPVTPHPEYQNCRQCHVPAKTNSLFVNSTFKRKQLSKIGQKALLSSPPVIPHSLQLRENCLACHAGPSAPKEIRVSHPERVNCRQCHAQTQTVPIEWTRLATKEESAE